MSKAQVQDLRPPSSRRLVPTWELFVALVAKELKVKYKRSLLGFVWSLLTPLALTAVYLFVFIYVYKVPKQNYVLVLLSGLLPWNYFNMSILAATSSLVTNGPVIRKVYFPRVLVPISAVGANLINFMLALMILLPIVALAGTLEWRGIPILLLAIMLESLVVVGAALILSIGNVYLRDIQQVASIFMMVLFFATPIVYELSQVPDGFRGVILANPLSVIMELYRAALLGARMPASNLLALVVAETAGLFALGYWIFSRFSVHLAKEV